MSPKKSFLERMGLVEPVKKNVKVTRVSAAHEVHVPELKKVPNLKGIDKSTVDGDKKPQMAAATIRGNSTKPVPVFVPTPDPNRPKEAADEIAKSSADQSIGQKSIKSLNDVGRELPDSKHLKDPERPIGEIKNPMKDQTGKLQLDLGLDKLTVESDLQSHIKLDKASGLPPVSPSSGLEDAQAALDAELGVSMTKKAEEYDLPPIKSPEKFTPSKPADQDMGLSNIDLTDNKVTDQEVADAVAKVMEPETANMVSDIKFGDEQKDKPAKEGRSSFAIGSELKFEPAPNLEISLKPEAETLKQEDESDQEEAAAKKAEEERLESERLKAEKAEKEKLAQEKLEKERLEREKSDKEKAEKMILQQETQGGKSEEAIFEKITQDFVTPVADEEAYAVNYTDEIEDDRQIKRTYAETNAEGHISVTPEHSTSYKVDPRIGDKLDLIIGAFEKNKLQTIEEIYRNSRMETETKRTIFMIEVFLNAMPANLPQDVKRETVLNILNISGIELDTLLGDAYKRIDSLNTVLEETVNVSKDILERNQNTIHELEKRIQDLNEVNEARHKFQEDQNTMIDYEIQKVINLVEFVKPKSR